MAHNTSGLRPFNQMSKEEARAIASKAGKKSAEKRAYNRSFKQAMEWALEMGAFAGNPTVDALHERYPDLNNRDAMAIAMTAKAIQHADVKAFEAVRDTTGELPVQTVNVKNEAPIEINIRTVD